MRGLVVLIFTALLFTGCSDSDNGGTSGGVGDLTCESIAGNYTYEDGGSINFMDNCEFTFSTTDGSGRGKFTVISDNNIVMNMLVTSGAAAGCAISIDARLTGDQITETNIITRDCG